MSANKSTIQTTYETANITTNNYTIQSTNNYTIHSTKFISLITPVVAAIAKPN